MRLPRTVEEAMLWAESVTSIRAAAEANYEHGGHYIVEAFTDEEIIESFVIANDTQPAAKTVLEAGRRSRDFCLLREEIADDIRAAGR